MKVLVTGGSGLVGRYVVDGLVGLHDVDVIDIKPPQKTGVRHFAVDVLDLSSLVRLVHGYDAVVHLAGIPHPLNNPPEEVYRTNALGTFNILEACALAGVLRFVFMSSESTLGFAFSRTRIAPLYLPIDEAHPLRPQDPYGLSKVTGELLCRGYSERYSLETVCLRAPWIWVPEDKERAMYRQLVHEYPKWYKNLWACIHVNDVVGAIQQSLESTLERKHDVFFICADENWTGKESVVLASEFYPETIDVKPAFHGTASFISTAKAKIHLKFKPGHKASDIFL